MMAKSHTELDPENKGFSPLTKQMGLGIPLPSENHKVDLEPANSFMLVDKDLIPTTPPSSVSAATQVQVTRRGKGKPWAGASGQILSGQLVQAGGLGKEMS